MFSTLSAKLSLVLLVLVFLSGVLFFNLMHYSSGMYQQEVQQKINSQLASKIALENELIQHGKVDQAALQTLFNMLLVINPQIDVYLLDSTGRVLAASTPQGEIKRRQVSMTPLQRFLRGRYELPILGDDPKSENSQVVFSVASLRHTGKIEGYLYLILGGEKLTSIKEMVQRSYVLRQSLWSLGAILLVALLTGLLFFAMLTKRLRYLSDTMTEYSVKPDVSVRYHYHGMEDEIDRLGASFNAMADRLDQHIAALKKSDAQRRELIANVSHDLRTPVTSLHGYLETLLLKADVLDESERERYLKVAVARSERLAVLVSELFELAILEDHDIQTSPEPFNLQELVQDVVQQYKLSADEKGVIIKRVFGKDMPFIYGDVGLIQRALENLLNNAVNHTPSGGEVLLSLSVSDKGVMVEIKDNGEGIPANELPHIFERFYRVKKSRDDHGRHAGLGLAITKRIVELHGEDLEVQSTLGSGTSFKFQLPIWRQE